MTTGAVILQLVGGETVLVDVEDVDLVLSAAAPRWRASRCGTMVYARTGRHGHDLYMHRLLSTAARIDHRDGDGLDNRRQNLREATKAQNAANSRKASGKTSRFKGVAWFARTARWRAQITVDGRQRHLGYHDDEETAARRYDDAAREEFGEYARTNFD